jgi:hypothetical protein
MMDVIQVAVRAVNDERASEICDLVYSRMSRDAMVSIWYGLPGNGVSCAS